MTAVFTACTPAQSLKSSQKAHLFFTGNLENIRIVIDNGSMQTVKAGARHTYEVTPGRHIVLVFEGSELIEKREIFISSGALRAFDVHPKPKVSGLD